jgi:poly-gamma-glutamate synthesis protein (capsule biosynthesis protein)
VRQIATLLLLFGIVSVTACGDEPAGGGPEPVAVIETVVPTGTVAASVTPGLTTTPSPTAAPASPPADGVLTLNAVGDLMLARDIITMMDEEGSVFPFADVRHLLADADLTIANMEGTFTDRGVAADKFYTFRTPPHHAIGLAEAGIDVVSLGNNHAMDFGDVALSDTLAAFDAARVRHSGAGLDAAAARRPVVLEAEGLRLAFLSYNAVTESTPAGPSSPGVAWGDEASIRADVAAAKAASDLVIVSLHAGTEYVDAPNAVQRQLARAAADAGAALVLGHHAHVFQGWERYGQSVIVYGLGNFVFDLDTEDLATLGPRPFQTAVLRFELTRTGVTSVTARPVYIDPLENRPLPATGDAARQIEERIERLNTALR